MFLFTWPIMLASSGVLPFKVPFIISLLVGWGIVIASLMMTGLTVGKEGVAALLRRFLIWRVGCRWYLVAVLLYPAILLAAVLVNSVLTRTAPDFSTALAHGIFGPSAALPVYALPFLLTDAITNGEEIGWRGYVLPRLQARYSALVSSLLVGVIWAVWHLPKFAAPGNTSPLGLFALKILADAVMYTWLYNNTRGSLLIVTIFHASGNTAGIFLPVATTVTGTNSGTLAVQVLLEILLATIVTVTQGPGRLSRSAEKQVVL